MSALVPTERLLKVKVPELSGFSRATDKTESSIVKSSQIANPRNAFCIEQRATAKSKEARVRVFGLFLLLPRLAPVGLIAR